MAENIDALKALTIICSKVPAHLRPLIKDDIFKVIKSLGGRETKYDYIIGKRPLQKDRGHQTQVSQTISKGWAKRREETRNLLVRWRGSDGEVQCNIDEAASCVNRTVTQLRQALSIGRGTASLEVEVNGILDIVTVKRV